MGLAGSSAICTSVLQCLMAFYGLTDEDIPKHIQVGIRMVVTSYSHHRPPPPYTSPALC